MEPVTLRQTVRLLSLSAFAAALGGCATTLPPVAETRNQIIISVRDQKLTVVRADHTRQTFPISTSKFGLGDKRGTYETPTGQLAVVNKFGDGAPVGSVFHGRVRTGEVVKIDAPGRDAIVTRILQLRGLENTNRQAFSRGIYIHGTPEERNIGRPTSYGCIRMRSSDVIKLYDMVRVGATVQIIDTTMNQAIASNIVRPLPAASAPTGVPATIPVPVNIPPGASLAAEGSTQTTATTTTTTTIAPASGTATTTTTTTGTTAPAGRKGWAGAPTQLLARQNANDERARRNAPKPPDNPSNVPPAPNQSADDSPFQTRSSLE